MFSLDISKHREICVLPGYIEAQGISVLPRYIEAQEISVLWICRSIVALSALKSWSYETASDEIKACIDWIIIS